MSSPTLGYHSSVSSTYSTQPASGWVVEVDGKLDVTVAHRAIDDGNDAPIAEVLAEFVGADLRRSARSRAGARGGRSHGRAAP
jgi:hypothetical protein